MARTRIGVVRDVGRKRPRVRRKALPCALRLLAPVVAAMLIVAACGGDDDASDVPAEPEPTAAPSGSDDTEPAAPEPAADDASDAMEEPETLKIGLMTGLSGGFAPWGTQFHDSLNLWAEMVNDGPAIAVEFSRLSGRRDQRWWRKVRSRDRAV